MGKICFEVIGLGTGSNAVKNQPPLSSLLGLPRVSDWIRGPVISILAGDVQARRVETGSKSEFRQRTTLLVRRYRDESRYQKKHLA